MRPFSSLLLFAAATTAADVTTSIWMPNPYSYSSYYNDYMTQNYTGEVVGKNGDNITMAIVATVVYESELASSRTRTRTTTGDAATITIMGSDRWKYESIYVGYSADTTYSSECSIATSNFKAVCTMSVYADDMWEDECSYYNSRTRSEPYPITQTYTFDTVTVTEVSTYTPYTYSTPSYCLSGTTLPASYYLTTRTYPAKPYSVIVTKGADQLTATAGSTPTGSGAQPTGSGTGAGTGNGTSGTQGGSNSAPTNSGNAANPMITAAPMLVGFGAAAAAMFL